MTSATAETLPEVIRHLLEERGVSASRASREMGLSESALRNYLSKQGARPSERTVQRMAEYFGIDSGILLVLAGRAMRLGGSKFSTESLRDAQVKPVLAGAIDEITRWAAFQSEIAQAKLAQALLSTLSLLRDLARPEETRTEPEPDPVRSEVARLLEQRGNVVAGASAIARALKTSASSGPSTYLTEEDHPVLAKLWNNDYDAIYDSL